MNETAIVDVWIEHPVMDLNQTFSYALAPGQSVSRGVRVRVPFASQSLVGFVDGVRTVPLSLADYEKQVGYQVKAIAEVIDQTPVLTPELYDLGLWMARQTIAPTISCFQAMLPKQMKPHSNATKAVKEYYVAVKDSSKAVTDKQREALTMLAEGPMLRRLFRESYPYIYTALVKSGAITVTAADRKAVIGQLQIKPAPYKLTDQQVKAIAKIQASSKDVILLHGLTGSGKTEIYMQLAAERCQAGKQVLILVPEIALTPQMVRRMTERFGSNIAIYHSRLTDQQRYEQYQLVANHQVKIVIGTRSAVFMPFDDLGLIVMDEEHDHSYKQDSMPRYNCRDVAIRRAQTYRCKLVLGSATPTLESYARAVKGVYELVTLANRINQDLPVSHLVDMRQQIKQHHYFVSEPLRQAIAQRLAVGQQCILLLNRRGYTPIMRCAKCGYVVTCPHCDIAMSYHKDENLLKCHTCGTTMDPEIDCPKCGGHSWMNYGLGTERLTDEIAKLFPTARILRMDADTTARKGGHAAILDAFERHEADILVGTQMIAKGLDYPHVTLVGIFNADALLARQDYRSVEMTFDLIVQASGRSGRGATAGEVYVQAFDCTHYGITMAVRQDYVGFFKQEMEYRHLGKYPPYRYLIAIEFASHDDGTARQAAADAKAQLQDAPGVRLLGPSGLTRKADEFRYRIILQGADEQAMRQQVWQWYDRQRVSRATLKISIDVDPYALD